MKVSMYKFMEKNRMKLGILFFLLMMAMTLVGCGSGTTNSSSNTGTGTVTPIPTPTDGTGAGDVTLTMSSNETLAEKIVSYTFSGTGPNSGSISYSAAKSSMQAVGQSGQTGYLQTLKQLAVGEWSIIVEGKDSSGTVVASATTTVKITKNGSATSSLTLIDTLGGITISIPNAIDTKDYRYWSAGYHTGHSTVEYALTIKGPNGETASKTVTKATLADAHFEWLTPGTWTVTLNATYHFGEGCGSGQTTVTVKPGEASEAIFTTTF